MRALVAWNVYQYAPHFAISQHPCKLSIAILHYRYDVKKLFREIQIWIQD